jgi:hypothetical protein
MRQILLSAFVLILIAGCAPTATPTPAVVPTLPLVSTPAVPLPDDVLVIYHKSGGIAGVDDTLTVHQGGLLELVSRDGTKSVKADEPMIQPLRRMLEQKDFDSLQPMYQASGADLFVYSITARDSAGRPKVVTTMDTAKHPDYLGLLIAQLEVLRGQVK